MASNGIIEFNGDFGVYLEEVRRKKAEKQKRKRAEYYLNRCQKEPDFKEKKNKKARERRQNDPEYREKSKEWSAEYRNKNREKLNEWNREYKKRPGKASKYWYKEKAKDQEYLERENKKRRNKYHSSPEKREKVREYGKQYRKDPKNKEKMTAYHRKMKYGVTKEETESKYAEQGGACYLCGEKYPLYGKSRKTKVLCQDHDHETGKPRDLLCKGCNNKLGAVEDKEFLAKALLYLKRHGRS